MASEATTTVIGRLCTVRGEITGEGDVRIDGTLEGSVLLTGARITVGPEAKVKAQLSAQDIVIAGSVEGEVRATGRAELRSTATLVGNVFASRFSMEDDASVRGHIDLNQPEKNAVSGTEPEGATQSAPTSSDAAEVKAEGKA